MAGSFTAEVDAWVLQTRQRMIAVFRTAAQYVIEDVRDRSPVDTGFLRSSWTVSLDGPLPMRSPNPGGAFGFEPQSYSLQIAGADLGSTIYASFVANYAGHVEYGSQGRAGVGMVRLAAQAWPQHVAKAVAEAKARVASNARG